MGFTLAVTMKEYPARLVIIDVSTLSLSYQYQQRLLELIQSWSEQGVSVLYSSNDLDHLFSVTDRIIILHQGKMVSDQRTDETTREDVVKQLLDPGLSETLTPYTWDFDSYSRIQEHTERLRYHSMLLEKELVAEGTLNRQLTEQLVEQFRALDRTNNALRDAQKRLLSEREQERKHLAREIHDQIIQDLLGVNYELEDISINKEFSPLLENYLTSIRGGIRELVVSLRRICGDLRPPTIDSLGLQAAIQSYAQEWSQRSGIEITLKLEKKLRRLPEATELSIFRIIQESLNNVWKHANASSVGISLQHTSPRMLRISIVDDGKGMQENLDLEELASAGHFGLLGISERVALLGGRLHLENIPDGGSLLVVEIPHPRMTAPA